MKKVRAALVGILLLAVLIGSQTIDLSETGSVSGETAAALEPTPLTTRAQPENLNKKDSESPAGNKPAQHPEENKALASSKSSTPVPKWAVLEEQMRRDTEGLSLKIHPDGHGSLHGQGRFTHMSAAVKDETGRLVIQCFEGYAGLDDRLSGRTQAPSAHPETSDYEVSDF